jgi:hypothetical protein
MEHTFTLLLQGIQKYHGEYFIGGLFIGLNNPRLGWSLMAFTMAIPTIAVLKNSEWITKIRAEPVEHILLFSLLALSSHLYIIHCLSRASGLM